MRIRRFRIRALAGVAGAGVICALSVAFAQGFIFDIPSLAEPETAMKPKTSFHNVQVLDHQTATELYATMAYFKQSLGVQCRRCHVLTAYHEDDDPKKIKARAMIRMVRGINVDHFEDDRVLCFTCHQGGVYPLQAPVSAMGKGAGGVVPDVK